ncbi:biogenesis of lysosome-related organelles complex 1 subunit 6-like isoform X1 [Armigeres subalbatus]|uniref:biogenesis of lysosome-related organelles complex 1 subunit 6-like isoform X1 n=2 Tax=Armigeres subalbatus TaxID=124917 RepID=UPI002ED0D12A
MSEDIAEGVDTGEYTEAVRVLSSGLLEMYEPTINQMKSNLKELLDKQEEMQVAIAEQKLTYTTQEVQQINEMVNKAKLYKDKAVRIKNQMHQIHQRTKSLRTKALDIQELKVNQCASKLQQLHYEESLVANSKMVQNKKS